MQNSRDASKWRVLVADDEPDNLKLAADLLEFLGAAVAQAKNGQNALDMVDEFKPNLILLDLAMPEVDGWEVHKRLRTNIALQQVPIVALTALAMKDDAEKVWAAGFDGYITKPFRVKVMIDQLFEIVQTFKGSESKPNVVKEAPPVVVAQETPNV